MLHPFLRRMAPLALGVTLALTLAGCAGSVATLSQRLSPQLAADNVAAAQPSDAPPALPPGTPAIVCVAQAAASGPCAGYARTFVTIQAAVNAAVPGQMILIAPGVYQEAVRVCTPHLTLRGMDRNQVVLDGGNLLGDGVYVGAQICLGGIPADDVIIENMTARHYAGNGFYWDGVTGYRGSYLTAYDNGDYGIYAFGARRGQFDHDYASGSPDSGFYIGQCYPCDALISHVTSEGNALGYSGTNAGGNLVIRDSVWDDNGTGILPNTLDSEKLAPEHQTIIVDNLVYNNNNASAPFKSLEYPSIGTGIAVPGGDQNLIENNLVEGQRNYGILVVGNIDVNLWTPQGNTVVNNTVIGSGVADLALATPAGPDNCFSGNVAAKTLPPLLQQMHGCGTIGARMSGGDFGVMVELFGKFFTAGGAGFDANSFFTRCKTYPAPPALARMPGDLTAPVGPIFTESWTSGSYDRADPHVINSTKAVAAVPFNSLLEILLGFYSYLLPIALYAAWVGIALWDIARREGQSTAARYGWMAAIVGVPVLGAIAYYIFGKPALTRGFRWMLVGGSLGIWLVATVVLIFAASTFMF